MVYFRVLSNYVELNKLGEKLNFPSISQNAVKILKSPCAVGVKFRLLICKLFGLKVYVRIFK